MKMRIFSLMLVLALVLSGCNGNTGNGGNPDTSDPGTQGEVTDLGDDNKTFGDSLDDLGVYDGYCETESADIRRPIKSALVRSR